MDHFEVITDAQTGEKVIRPYTEAEIAALGMQPAQALAAVLASIASVEAALTAGVPLGEKLSWTAKEQAALAVFSGNDSPADTALLAGEASITGETVAELAQRIIAAAEAYRFAASRMAGIRRAAEKAIAVAADAAALEQAVATAQAQCAAIIEASG